jgi:predicted PurR-regulated permease PerM
MSRSQRVTATTVVRAVLLAAGLVAAGLVFAQLKTLLLAVLVSVIVALPLSAIAGRLERAGVPRAIGAVIGLIAVVATATGLALLVIPSFVHETGKFVDELPRTVARVDRDLGLHSGAIERAAQHFSQRYTRHPLTLLGPLASIGVTAATAIAALIVILITALYMAINPAPLVANLLRLVPPEQRPATRNVLVRVREAWVGWLKGVGLDAIVLGVLLYAGLTLIGLDFAVGFALFSAFMTVIPNYGSIISAIPPLLFAAAQSPAKALLVIAVYVVVNQIEGNLILPLIMARTVNIHPAVVAIGVVFAGALFGFMGLVISIPLISLVLILVEELWVRPREAQAIVAEREPG